MGKRFGGPCDLDGVGEVASGPDSGAIRAHYGSVTSSASANQDQHQRSRVARCPQGQRFDRQRGPMLAFVGPIFRRYFLAQVPAKRLNACPLGDVGTGDDLGFSLRKRRLKKARKSSSRG